MYGSREANHLRGRTLAGPPIRGTAHAQYRHGILKVHALEYYKKLRYFCEAYKRTF